MKQSLGGFSFIIISVVLVLVGIWYYVFSKVVATTKDPSVTTSGDSSRTHTVNDLATKISFLASKQTNSGVAFPSQWQQLGTAGSGCELSTGHCTITESSCFNMESLAGGKFQIPFDASRGTAERTGYAIKQEDQVIYIIACFAESDSAISQKIKIQ